MTIRAKSMRSPAHQLTTLAVLVSAAILLSGCSAAVLSSFPLGFTDDAVAPPPSTVPLVYRGPIYCYDTLADPNCFAEPFPKPDERFIGALVENDEFPDIDGPVETTPDGQ